MFVVPHGLWDAAALAPPDDPALTLVPPQAATKSPATASSVAARSRLVLFLVTRSSLVARSLGGSESVVRAAWGGPSDDRALADLPRRLGDPVQHHAEQHDGDTGGEPLSGQRDLL